LEKPAPTPLIKLLGLYIIYVCVVASNTIRIVILYKKEGTYSK